MAIYLNKICQNWLLVEKKGNIYCFTERVIQLAQCRWVCLKWFWCCQRHCTKRVSVTFQEGKGVRLSGAISQESIGCTAQTKYSPGQISHCLCLLASIVIALSHCKNLDPLSYSLPGFFLTDMQTLIPTDFPINHLLSIFHTHFYGLSNAISYIQYPLWWLVLIANLKIFRIIKKMCFRACLWGHFQGAWNQDKLMGASPVAGYLHVLPGRACLSLLQPFSVDIKFQFLWCSKVGRRLQMCSSPGVL